MHPVHRPIAVRPCLRLEIFQQVRRSPCRQLRWPRDTWSFLSWRSPDVALEETHLVYLSLRCGSTGFGRPRSIFYESKGHARVGQKGKCKGNQQEDAKSTQQFLMLNVDRDQ